MNFLDFFYQNLFIDLGNVLIVYFFITKSHVLSGFLISAASIYQYRFQKAFAFGSMLILCAFIKMTKGRGLLLECSDNDVSCIGIGYNDRDLLLVFAHY